MAHWQPLSASVFQSAMGLQMPAAAPASLPNTVTVHVDRQLLTQLALPQQPAAASDVPAMEGPLLQQSGRPNMGCILHPFVCFFTGMGYLASCVPFRL